MEAIARIDRRLLGIVGVAPDPDRDPDERHRHEKAEPKIRILKYGERAHAGAVDSHRGRIAREPAL